MMRYLATLLLAFVVGCEFDSTAPKMEDYSVLYALNPDSPDSIAAWEASSFNYNRSKLVVLQSQFLHGDLGNGEPKQPTRIIVEIAGALDHGPTSEQDAALDYIREHEQELHRVTRKAVYEDYIEYYPETVAVWGANEPDVAPKVVDGDELDSIVGFGTVYIHHPVDGIANVGISLGIPWTEDDMGVLLRESELVEVGQAFAAMPLPPTDNGG